MVDAGRVHLRHGWLRGLDERDDRHAHIHWYPPFGTTQFLGPHVGYSCNIPPTGSSGTSWVSQAYTFTQEWISNFAP
jgi:hypothetical protein